MEIRTVDVLQGLRAALSAPDGERDAVFDREVVEPLRPLWEPWLRRVPPAPGPGGAPEDEATRVARTFRFYRPELGSARGLEGLERLERARAWETSVAALERAALALAPERHGVDVGRVDFAFALADPVGMDARLDHYTGVGNVPGWVLLLAWPTESNLPRLAAVAVHELHHNVRFRVEPAFPMTLGQYLVAEGLAEAFAAEECGEETLGRWATTLRGPELDALRPRFREALDEDDFAVVRGYVFGDWAAAEFGYEAQGLPDFAGYAIGYRLVRAYLARTGRSAAEATYLPWREIVEEARWL